MVFGVAALANGRAFSFEVQRGGIEEHHVQTGEQVPALREQLLLDQVFIGAGRKRGCGILLVFGENFSQPCHRSIQMLQVQLAGAVDGIVLFPLLGGAITARREQPMQHTEEDRAFDGELELRSRNKAVRTLSMEQVCQSRWPISAGPILALWVVTLSPFRCAPRMESFSENRPSDRRRVSSWPLATSSSSRPRRCKTRCLTLPLTQVLSTMSR